MKIEIIRPESKGDANVSALTERITIHMARIEDRLQTRGAVLFRDFGLRTVADFERANSSISNSWMPYTEGQSERIRVRGEIYTSTEYPADQDITLHNELSYTCLPPRFITFFCETAPSTGGQTPLVDCRLVYKNIDESIRERFSKHGILYVKNMHGGQGFGKSWQEHFESHDPNIVEKYLSSAGVDYEWLPDSGLRTRQIRPATVEHPETGEWLWFNQADLWHYSNLDDHGEKLLNILGESRLPIHAYLGDGSSIAPEDIRMIRDTRNQLAMSFDWRPGDLLWLDNWLMAHGRKSYTGNRRILVAMT